MSSLHLLPLFRLVRHTQRPHTVELEFEGKEAAAVFLQLFDAIDDIAVIFPSFRRMLRALPSLPPFLLKVSKFLSWSATDVWCLSL